MMARSRLLTILTICALAVACIVLAGYWPRLAKQKALVEAATESDHPPVVRVATVALTQGSAELELPCDLMALMESPINARVEGYIGKRTAEIGQWVKKGDFLAELDTPELDQQYLQAKATLAQNRASLKQLEAKLLQTRASMNLAKITSERWKKLTAGGVLSRQDADEKQATYEVQQAEEQAAEASIAAQKEALIAADANLQRLQQMKSYSRLLAPFDGVVTWRSPDVGTLISPGSGGKDLFKVADISVIRVFVGIPQSAVPYVVPGIPVTLTVDDLPGRTFPARVSNIANALDPATRTMLAVIKIQNPDKVLKPGMYSRVKIHLKQAAQALQVPGDAVVARSQGPSVAVVDDQHRVHYRKIEIARDEGKVVQVSAGISAGDLVVINPNDEIRENRVVEIAAAAKK
ncbi:MAG: efflux RND transporter periplasmic adaptor subunit [Bryobacteraceae bacterium]